MKFKNLSPETLEKINGRRYDRILEKHEGPESWSSVLKFYEPEFLQIDGHDVLLPIPGENHPNVTILRTIVGDNGNSLVVFFKDTSYVTDPRDEPFFSGFMAVCDKVPGEEFFLGIVYHEWFIIEPGE